MLDIEIDGRDESLPTIELQRLLGVVAVGLVLQFAVRHDLGVFALLVHTHDLLPRQVHEPNLVDEGMMSGKGEVFRGQVLDRLRIAAGKQVPERILIGKIGDIRDERTDIQSEALARHLENVLFSCVNVGSDRICLASVEEVRHAQHGESEGHENQSSSSGYAPAHVGSRIAPSISPSDNC
ncbi:MAG: hypothetical protein R3D05_09940 [Dongiaceae bacterium]